MTPFRIVMPIVLAAASHALSFEAKAQGSVVVPPLDVISVKLDNSGLHDGAIGLRADGLYVTHAPFRFLLIAAFGNDFAEEHIANMPAWAGDEFDIIAKVADEDLPKLRDLHGARSIEMRSRLLQAVLAERFGLKTHTEERQGRVYALVVAKGGAKVQPSGENPPANYVSPQGQHVQMGTLATKGQIAGHVAPMAMLVRSLNATAKLDRVVIDKTGLAGNYDYALNWTPDPEVVSGDVEAKDTSLPPLFTAIQEQLGLRLEPASGDIQTLVIDHIEKPSGN